LGASRLQQSVLHACGGLAKLYKEWAWEPLRKLDFPLVCRSILSKSRFNGVILYLRFPCLKLTTILKLRPRTQAPIRSSVFFVLQAIGTRYVGKSAKNPKVDAALHNFDALVRARANFGELHLEDFYGLCPLNSAVPISCPIGVESFAEMMKVPTANGDSHASEYSDFEVRTAFTPPAPGCGTESARASHRQRCERSLLA
jgi:hypothetical protein